MKVSLIVTVLNEEKSIKKLIDSIVSQSKLPDEIIIIDGGSTDNTLSIISNLKYKISNKKIKLYLFVKPGASIAVARNYGIKRASSEIIAMIDAGCVAYRDWLAKITSPFETQGTDLVAGFYRMTGSTPLQKALSVFLGIPPQRFNRKKFLPSARSMAFRKSLWEKIGGFNERLDKAGEDTLFNYQAVKKGAKIVRVKSALVDWEVPKNLREGFLKFYVYAKGDVQAGIWWHPKQRISTHNLKILSVFLRYIIGLTLLVFYFLTKLYYLLFTIYFLLFLYLFWSILKNYKYVKDPRALFWLPVLQLTSDIAVVLGSLTGFTLCALKKI